MGGHNSSEGRVEIYYDGQWGTICDNQWDINDATVVNNSLGFPGAASAPKRVGALAVHGSSHKTLVVE